MATEDAQDKLAGPVDIERLRAILEAPATASDKYRTKRHTLGSGETIMVRTCDLDEARQAVLEAFDDDTLRSLLDEIERLRRFEDGVRCVKLGLTTPELFMAEAMEGLRE